MTDINTNVEEALATKVGGLLLGERKLNFSGESLFEKIVHKRSAPINIETAPMYLTGLDGSIYDPKERKMVLNNGQFVGDVSRRYTVIANEKVYQLIQDAGFKPERTEFDARGNKMFVQVFSDDASGLRPHTFTTDKGGDKIEVGLMVRNDISGHMGFGGDLFTYRSRCSNGAVIGKKELGSFTVKHVGEYTRLVSVMKAMLNRAFDLGMKIKPFYQKATEVAINQEIADKLLKTEIPHKFLPDFMKAITKKNTPTQLILERKDATVWEGFNALTEKAWHGTDLGITTRRQYTERANAWLMNAVAPLIVA
jgi:hypothetical protein